MLEVCGVNGRLTVPGRIGPDGNELVAAALSNVRGSVQNGRVELTAVAGDRPYRVAVGTTLTLDFSTSTSRRAGVLRCPEVKVVSYDHPVIVLTGAGIAPSPVKSLNR